MKRVLLLLFICAASVANSQEKAKETMPNVSKETPAVANPTPKKETNVTTRKVVARPEQLKAVKPSANVEPIKD